MQLPALVMDSLRETKSAYLELNVDQLKRGIRRDGNRIGRYKDPDGYYARKKARQNPLPGQGFVDLIHYGDFSEQLDVDVSARAFRHLSRDEKDEKLTQDYGDQIYGLTVENRKAYTRENMRPVMRNKIVDILNGKP